MYKNSEISSLKLNQKPRKKKGEVKVYFYVKF